MKPKSDQVEIFLPRKFFIKWEAISEPSVVVDYEYFDAGDYVVSYIAFTPEVLLAMRPDSKFDIVQEVNEAVYQIIVDNLNDSYMHLIERIGIERRESA
ncbi:MAG TPA: hypothetical protein V6C58_12665 [Allocoleopsis sp.]